MAFEAPVALREVGAGAFRRCASLESAALNEGLETLGKRAFADSGLQSVRLPSTLRALQYGTFRGCEDLKEVQFSEGLESIESMCFTECGLGCLAVPSSVVEIANRAFYCAGCLKEVTFAAESRLERVGDNAFARCALGEFVAPEALRELGCAVFSGCERLRRVHLNKRLERVGQFCFPDDCKRVVEWPAEFLSGRENNARSSFFCRGLVFAPESGKKTLGEQDVWGVGLDARARTLAVPESVERIEEAALREPNALRRLLFQGESRLAEIGREAFAESRLEAFEAPASLRVIGQGAFSKCERLECVKLNEGLEVLGEDGPAGRDEDRGVFERTCLEKVDLPGTLRVLGRRSFLGCASLREVQLSDGIKAVGVACFAGTGLRQVTLPASVVEVAEDAFYGCSELQRVDFGVGSWLERIGLRAFAGTALGEFVAPA